MALPKLFQRIFWHNNTTPAINEDNLNAMSKAIDDIDNRVIALGDDVITVIPQIQAYLDQAEDLVEAMELLSENPPYIGQNGNWWVWDTNTSAFVDSGVDASISVDIADITMLAPNAEPYVTNSGTDTDPIFHLFIPRGQTGNGISTIAKTGTSGLVDTYTITMTDGTTSTFTVTNGSGDMNKSVYDPTNAIANAGGMKSAATKNSTNAVTANSTNLVESGAVYTEVNSVKTALANNVENNGSKNAFAQIDALVNGNGITYYRDSNGVITWSGTLTGSFTTVVVGSTHLRSGETYKLTGGIDTNAQLSLRYPNGDMYQDNTDSKPVVSPKPSYAVDTFTANQDADVNIVLRIARASTVSDEIKPMLCLKSDYDLDPTYVPPAKTNRQLTQDSVTWTDEAQIGAVNYAKISLTTQVDGIYSYNVSDDKIITVTVASTTSLTSKEIASTFTLKKGTYKFSGVPTGQYIDLILANASTSTTIVALVGNDSAKHEVIFTLANDTSVSMRISWHSGIPAGTYVFKPMITPVSYNGPYVPYAMTNKELTEVKTTSVTAKGVTLNIVKSGNVCVSRFSGSLTENVALDTTILTIPVGYRPISQVVFLTSNKLASLSNYVAIAYHDNGAVQPSGAGVATGDVLRGSACWITLP